MELIMEIVILPRLSIIQHEIIPGQILESGVVTNALCSTTAQLPPLMGFGLDHQGIALPQIH